MKLGIIGYLPPLNFQHGLTSAFLRNLEKFPPRNEAVFYMNPTGEFDVSKITPNPPVRLKIQPEQLDAHRQNPRWGINNALFVVGMRIAREKGFTHVIYLEADCRAGEHGWDEVMFEEYFNLPFPPICAGTLVCWNPCNHGLDVYRRWESLLARNTARNFPVATYGVREIRGETPPPCVFPNGAGGVYDVEWMSTLFDLYNTTEVALGQAWDFRIGAEIWKRFGIHSFDVVEHMESVFSGYGEDVTTEDQRLAMLADHKAVLVHQVKSGRGV